LGTRERTLCKKAIFAAFPKIEFLTGGNDNFLEVTMKVGYFLHFFQIFTVKGRASINGCKSLGTRERRLSKSGYFAGL
jgi:hypothetical protein